MFTPNYGYISDIYSVETNPPRFVTADLIHQTDKLKSFKSKKKSSISFKLTMKSWGHKNKHEEAHSWLYFLSYLNTGKHCPPCSVALRMEMSDWRFACWLLTEISQQTLDAMTFIVPEEESS